jgi:hypothetical protein
MSLQSIEELWEMLTEKHQRLQALHDKLSDRVGLESDPSATGKLESLSRTMGDLVKAVDQCQNDLLELL